GILRPSDGYIGRGVTEKSTDEYMLYHQNMFAHVKAGFALRATSQIFCACTRWLDCRQNLISASSRKYHPFPTIPCRAGCTPVTNVDCTEQVTAGKVGLMAAIRP